MSGVRTDARRLWRRSARYRPRGATGWIIVVTVVSYGIQLLTGGAWQALLQYSPLYSLPRLGLPFEPWRMLTALVIHQPIGPGLGIVGIAHIAFNMYALWLFGRPLESVVGVARLLAIYLVSGLAGSVGFLLFAIGSAQAGTLEPLQTAVYGASGAVFGVLGAVAMAQRRFGADSRSLYLMIAANFALGVLVPGIAWQAHLGGLLVGGLLGWVLVRHRGPRRNGRAALWTGAVVGVLLAITAAAAIVFPLSGDALLH